MSNSLVRFLNIKNFEIDFNVPNKISVEYVVDDHVQVSSSDWVALFPFGCDFWNSVNFDLMVAFEFVLSCQVNKKERRYNTLFSLKKANNLKYSFKYQFVYISRYSDIYGISKTFEFRPPVMKIIPEETNVSEASDDSSKENSESNTLKPNLKRRKGKLPALQSVGVRSEKSIFDTTMRGEEDQIDAKKFIDKFNRNKHIFFKKQINWQNQCVVQHPSPVPCPNCHRVAELLKVQEELYSKIKNIAEINGELRKQVGLVQHQLELSLAARQKANVTLMRERHARLFYQNLAYELAQQECQTVVVEPLSASSRLCDKEKTKAGYSALKLKAIIGDQEEKIRRLRKEIEQLKMEKARKVTVVVREVGECYRSEVPRQTFVKLETTKEDTSRTSEGERLLLVKEESSEFIDEV